LKLHPRRVAAADFCLVEGKKRGGKKREGKEEPFVLLKSWKFVQWTSVKRKKKEKEGGGGKFFVRRAVSAAREGKGKGGKKDTLWEREKREKRGRRIGDVQTCLPLARTEKRRRREGGKEEGGDPSLPKRGEEGGEEKGGGRGQHFSTLCNPATQIDRGGKEGGGGKRKRKKMENAALHPRNEGKRRRGEGGKEIEVYVSTYWEGKGKGEKKKSKEGVTSLQFFS